MSAPLVDTHAHLDDPAFDADRAEVLARAKAAGVRAIVNVGYNPERIRTTLALAEAEPIVYAAVGLHPTEAERLSPDVLAAIREAARHPKVVAIGEIGLDYHHQTASREAQVRAFRAQLDLARELGLPVIIHNRDAHDDVYALLREADAGAIGGVMHAFSGSEAHVEAAVALGFYLSLGGPVTFKNARALQALVPRIPLDRLVIETDAPYLAPHPYRGRRNESAHVRLVAEAVARLAGRSVEEIAHLSTDNAKRLFRLPSPDAPPDHGMG
ncbi:MAG: TatD family hydrolase [Hydrogenibacillus schlegelii]|uniref:TatD family hydrolase n=1 Tax=Hydrogenibacillus schlegelii TaxID=1484 RepID=A0A947CWI5_HYDSH|nr:TatD family hydrolase [Hydrogenibacillus schlegelii]MBT9282020.1 TatD family hydrolase [Hydrogenibacillus schlegelii]